MLERMDKLRLLIKGDKFDSSSDELIQTLIEVAESRFMLIVNRIQRRLGLPKTGGPPEGLNWIIDEVVIRRFNRLGSEGYDSQSVEGHSISFTQDEFLDFEDDILGFFEDEYTMDSRAGKVVIY